MGLARVLRADASLHYAKFGLRSIQDQPLPPAGLVEQVFKAGAAVTTGDWATAADLCDSVVSAVQAQGWETFLTVPTCDNITCEFQLYYTLVLSHFCPPSGHPQHTLAVESITEQETTLQSWAEESASLAYNRWLIAHAERTRVELGLAEALATYDTAVQACRASSDSQLTALSLNLQAEALREAGMPALAMNLEAEANVLYAQWDGSSPAPGLPAAPLLGGRAGAGGIGGSSLVQRGWRKRVASPSQASNTLQAPSNASRGTAFRRAVTSPLRISKLPTPNVTPGPGETKPRTKMSTASVPSPMVGLAACTGAEGDIIQSMKDGVLVVNARGVILRVNPALFNMLEGRSSPRQITKQPVHPLDVMYHPDNSSTECTIVDLIETRLVASEVFDDWSAVKAVLTGATENGEVSFTAAMRDKRVIELEYIPMLNNEQLANLKNARLQLDPKNEQCCTVAVGWWRWHEVAESPKSASLESSLAAKDEFLAFICHELRNPLNGAMGMASMLMDVEWLRRDQSPTAAERADVREHVRTILDCCDLMCSLVNDVLDFSKIESGKVQLEYAEFDMVLLLKEVCKIQALSSHRKSNVQLVCVNLTDLSSLPPGDPDLDCFGLLTEMNLPRIVEVVGDPLRFQQVMLNLTSNALKFTLSGHVMLGVEILPSRPEDPPSHQRLRVFARDSGIGIAAKNLSKLFLSYSQEKASITREFGGTGLGLAICKGLVDQMGGEIGVTSRLGWGSEFYFEISLPKLDFDPAVTSTSSNSGMPPLHVAPTKKAGLSLEQSPQQQQQEQGSDLWAWLGKQIASPGFATRFHEGMLASGVDLDSFFCEKQDALGGISPARRKPVDQLLMKMALTAIDFAAGNGPSATSMNAQMLRGLHTKVGGTDIYAFSQALLKCLKECANDSQLRGPLTDAECAQIDAGLKRAAVALCGKPIEAPTKAHSQRSLCPFKHAADQRAAAAGQGGDAGSSAQPQEEEETKPEIQSPAAVEEDAHKEKVLTILIHGDAQPHVPDDDEEAKVARQRDLVRSSWRKVEEIAAVAAAMFYARLFEIDPPLEELFKGVNMVDQGAKLTEMISLAVSQLRQVEKIVPALQALGQKHLRYGVRPEMYDAVGAALLWTLGQSLPDWDDELKGAWAWVYGVVSGQMKVGAEAVARKVQASRTGTTQENEEEQQRSIFLAGARSHDSRNGGEGGRSSHRRQNSNGVPSVLPAARYLNKDSEAGASEVMATNGNEKSHPKESGGGRNEHVMKPGVDQSNSLQEQKQSQSAETPVAQKPELQVPVNMDELKVLIVEDMPINQRILIKLLEKIGVQADVAKNGLEAVEMVRARVPSKQQAGLALPQYMCVLMDANMPIMTGYEATKRIRAMNCDVPIIAVTANALHKDREKSFAAGMCSFISKPYKQTAVWDVVRKFLPEGYVEKQPKTRRRMSSHASSSQGGSNTSSPRNGDAWDQSRDRKGFSAQTTRTCDKITKASGSGVGQINQQIAIVDV